MSVPFRILAIDRANGMVSVEYELPGGELRLNNITGLTRPAKLQTVDPETGKVLAESEHSIPVDLNDAPMVLVALRAYGERYYGQPVVEDPLAHLVGQRQE